MKPSLQNSKYFMFVAICHFSFDPYTVDSRLLQRLKDKVFAKFKLLLSEVGKEGEFILAAALVSKDENYLRSFFSKILEFIEETEGIRIENEGLEIVQR